MELKLGDGFSSEIRVCTINGQECAEKIYKQHYPQKLRIREIKILSTLQHKHIISIIQHDQDYKSFVCERMKTDFFNIVKEGGPITHRTGKQILLELSQTLSYVHNSGYVHRDLKLENVMINNNLEIKIIDFGFCDIVDQQKKYVRVCGTRNYMAPELFSQEKYIGGAQLKKCDVFALGIIIFTLLYGFPPFSEATQQCPYWRCINDQKWNVFWKIVNRQKTPDLLFQELFQRLITPDAQERFTVQQILDHPWIDGNHDLQELKNRV